MSKDELAQLGAEFHQWKARAEKAEAELDRVKKILDCIAPCSLEEAAWGIVRAYKGCVENLERVKAQLLENNRHHEQELEAKTDELERVNKANAEMREALRVVERWDHIQPDFTEPYKGLSAVMDCVHKALSATAAGTRYYSEAEVKPLVEALEDFAEVGLGYKQAYGNFLDQPQAALEHARALGIGKETK